MKILFFSLLLSILALSSCSKYQKLLKSNDRVMKYEKAMQYFEEEEWNRSKTLIEDIIPVYKGTDKGEELLFKFAYCHYRMRDYILAGYYFRKFTETYGNSKLVEEAAFRSAECYYLDSPRSSLDQSSTKTALLELELFMVKYQRSAYVTQSQELKNELTNKLAEKQYNNAMHFLHLEYYNSALTALNNCLSSYPYSKFREEILFYLLKSNFEYARNSVQEKQKARFSDAISAYYKYNDEFSEGKFAREAKRMFAISEKRVKGIMDDEDEL
jgi:outer membrane protein assembly factor BamD